MQCPDSEAKLGIVGTGKVVQFPGPRHLIEHFGKLGRAVDGVGKALRFDHKLRVLNFVQRPRAIGQLDTCLKCAVTLTGHRWLPHQGRQVEALHRERLATRAPGRRHRCQRRFAGHHGRRAFQCNRGDHINECIHDRTPCHRRQRKRYRINVVADQCRFFVGIGSATGGKVRQSLARRIAAGRPCPMRHHASEYQTARDRQSDV